MRKMTEQDGKSLDMVNENLEALKAIFPEAFTEDGVDFEVLRQLLGDLVDESEEKYGLTWHGKKMARQIALMPSLGTLRPCPEESVDWDTTQNLFIEGDNLEVLKLLQKSYANKVKMIYIDPPFNTGKEFIYPDKFQDNLDTYLRYTGQKDDDSFKISSNTESSGRYHTNWLNMMYPRLKLARNLLRDDGVLFISIDDNEIANLQKVCDEILGEENFIGIFVVNSTPNARDYGHIGKMHEYAIFYAKSADQTDTYLLPEVEKTFKFKDDISGFNVHPLYNSNVAFTPENRPNLYYPFYLYTDTRISPDFYEIGLIERKGAIKIFPPKSQKDGVQFVWRWGKKKAANNLNKEIIGYKTENDEYRIVQKMRHNSKLIRSLLTDKSVSTRRGTAEVENIFKQKLFSFPKPLTLLKTLSMAATIDNDLVLDMFAGSCTTAHAVLDLNNEDGGNRQFIMVQLPEPCDEKSEAFKAGYKTIAEIGKERIRRAAARIKEENPEYKGDLGFKVFKLDSSNIRAWNPDRNDLEQTLLEHLEHLVEGRSEEDVLYELLLKRGVDLTVPIEERLIPTTEHTENTETEHTENTEKEKNNSVYSASSVVKKVYSIGYGALFACLNESINRDEVETLAQGIIDWHKELEPASDTQVVFRDSAFANDIAKTNMTAILEQNGIKHVRSI